MSFEYARLLIEFLCDLVKDWNHFLYQVLHSQYLIPEDLVLLEQISDLFRAHVSQLPLFLWFHYFLLLLAFEFVFLGRLDTSKNDLWLNIYRTGSLLEKSVSS